MAYVRVMRACDLARNEMYGRGYEINLKGRGAASDHRGIFSISIGSILMNVARSPISPAASCVL